MQAVSRRTQIYVPGNNRRFLGKAAGLNSDSIILDLEDSVPAGEKDSARKLIYEVLSNEDFISREICARISTPDSPEGRKDMAFVSRVDKIDTLVVAKSEASLTEIHRVSGKNIIPLVETPHGFLNLEEIARSEGVVAIAWAAADLAALTEARVSAFESNPHILTSLTLVAHAYGIDAIDKVFFEVDNLDALLSEARKSREYGFAGKQIIHPSHIGPVQEIYSPDPGEIEWARKVVELLGNSEAAGRGALRLDGKLVDQVHFRMAERILRVVEDDADRQESGKL